jgi:hypothetical protein
MLTWSGATMSLSVHVFSIDDDGEMTFLDILPTASDLAGFESFRTSVRGSEAVRGLGARFFLSLASSDLIVAPPDVVEFMKECALLRANLDAIAPATEPGHSHEWYLDVISIRLSNIEQAGQRALGAGGGVLIW